MTSEPMTDTAELKPVAWRYRFNGDPEWNLEDDNDRLNWLHSTHGINSEPIYSAAALSSLVRERDELAERVDRMHGAEELLTAQNIIVRAVWDVLGGEDATRADGQNLIACVREITARATAAEAERDSWRRVSERLEGEKIAAEADAARMRDDIGKLSDPNAVHANLLRGSIARPSVAQIIHIYGEDAIRNALGGKDE